MILAIISITPALIDKLTHYMFPDEMFIVQWSTMVLGDDGVDREFFTFQTQLLKDGTIKFVYKEVS